MSRSIGQTVEILLRRVRQEGGLAVDVNLATEIYSRCEQIINVALSCVLVNATLNTPKQKLLFSLRTEFPAAASIVSFTQSNRTIPQSKTLDEFSAYSPDWFRSIDGTRFESWHPIGRDLFILFPGQAAASSLTITYVKLLTLHTSFAASYNTASELPDENIEAALILAEIILLCRFRLLSAIPKRLEQAASLLKTKGI